MNLEYIIQVYESLRPDWHNAKFILETEVDATSLVVSAWKKTGNEWGKISKDFTSNYEEVLSSAKVKYFVRNDTVCMFINDPDRNYYEHFLVPLQSAQQGDTPERLTRPGDV